MRFIRALIGGLWKLGLFTLGMTAAVAGVLAHGGRVYPRLDILAHFAPFWLAAGVVSGLMALPIGPWRRRIGFMAPGVVGAVAAALLMAPELLRKTGPRAPDDAPDQIKVIQFNTWGGNRDTGRTADWIVAQDADVVVIEEARPDIRDAILSRADYHVACGRCSVMIFSKRRPFATDAPPQPGDGPRVPMARASFRTAQGDYTVVGVHYTWPTGGDVQQRQGIRLAGLLEHFDRRRLILAGDFNSTPWSFTRRREDAMFRLERRTKALFTWPAAEFSRRRALMAIPWLPIDHIYAGEAWRTISVARGPKLGSDHFPVVARLALEP